MNDVKLGCYLSEEDTVLFFENNLIPKTCGSCRFFDEIENPTWVDSRVHDSSTGRGVCYEGFCRRYPPSFYDKDAEQCNWPLVDYDEWCGEYKTREE